jgi:hypothetical protein
MAGACLSKDTFVHGQHADRFNRALLNRDTKDDDRLERKRVGSVQMRQPTSAPFASRFQ